MVLIKVQVPEGVDELAGSQIADLGHHHGEESVGCDVEGNAEEKICAALVELAAEASVGDVELEQGMAWRERHLTDLSGVPSRYDEASAVRLRLDHLHDLGDLIDVGSVWGLPIGPLGPVNATQASVGFCPFIPDGDALLLEGFDVGVSAKEPEQLVDDAFEVELFGCEQGKALLQIEPDLRAKHGTCACTGTIRFDVSVGQDVFEEVEISFHAAERDSVGG